jgi:hypothetical protein
MWSNILSAGYHLLYFCLLKSMAVAFCYLHGNEFVITTFDLKNQIIVEG